MLDLDLLTEFDEDILNELYVGETAFINKLIDEVSKARAPYVGKMKKPIKGNKDFIKIGDMIAKEFGFHSVTFMVPFDTSLNAFTYPITMNIDKSIVNTKPKFYKDNGLKYDEKTSRLCILVAVTAGVWFNPKFTDREVVSAILHEIGHSFVLQSERMIDVIEANRLSIVFMVMYGIILKLILGMMNPAVLVTLPSDIKNIAKSSNKGKEIINQTTKELADNPLFVGVASVGEYISTVAMNVFKEIFVIFKGAINLISAPFGILDRILYPLNKQAYAVGRSQEYLSDSFAAMYGMGPEVSSFLMKIELDPSAWGSNVEKVIAKIPVIGALHETLNIPSLLLSNGISTHPSTPARINKILEELNKELKDSDLSPKTKEALKKNIKDLERIKDECTKPLDKKKYDAEMVKRMMISFISKKGEAENDYEDYYTDLKERDKYVKECEELFYDFELLESCDLLDVIKIQELL